MRVNIGAILIKDIHMITNRGNLCDAHWVKLLAFGVNTSPILYFFFWYEYFSYIIIT